MRPTTDRPRTVEARQAAAARRPAGTRDAFYRDMIEMLCQQRDAMEILLQQSGDLADDGIKDAIRHHAMCGKELAELAAHFRRYAQAEAAVAEKTGGNIL